MCTLAPDIDYSLLPGPCCVDLYQLRFRLVVFGNYEVKKKIHKDMKNETTH